MKLKVKLTAELDESEKRNKLQVNKVKKKKKFSVVKVEGLSQSAKKRKNEKKVQPVDNVIHTEVEHDTEITTDNKEGSGNHTSSSDNEVKRKKNKRKFPAAKVEENSVESQPAKRRKKEKNGNNTSSSNDMVKNKNKTNDSSIRKKLLLPHQIKNELESRTIFVGNLPAKFHEKNLRKLASQYGEIDTIRIRGAIPKCDKIPKKVAVYQKKFNVEQNSLIAYVQYEKVEDAQNALDLNGELFEERHLRVTLSSEKVFDKNKGIFIGNLPYKVTEEDLWDFFQDCGEILSARVIKDDKTGFCKGFAYVNFKSEDSVEFALKMNEEKFLGRIIRVQRLLSEGKLEKLKKKKELTIVEHHLPSRKSKLKKEITSNEEAFHRRFRSKKEKKTNDKPSYKFKIKNVSKTDAKKKKLAEKLLAKSKKKPSTS